MEAEQDYSLQDASLTWDAQASTAINKPCHNLVTRLNPRGNSRGSTNIRSLDTRCL